MPDRTPPPLAPIQGYQVKDWDGWKLYACDRCIFDSLSLANMQQHQRVGCRPPDGEWERDQAVAEAAAQHAPERYDE